MKYTLHIRSRWCSSYANLPRSRWCFSCLIIPSEPHLEQPVAPHTGPNHTSTPWSLEIDEVMWCHTSTGGIRRAQVEQEPENSHVDMIPAFTVWLFLSVTLQHSTGELTDNRPLDWSLCWSLHIWSVLSVCHVAAWYFLSCFNDDWQCDGSSDWLSDRIRSYRVKRHHPESIPVFFFSFCSVEHFVSIIKSLAELNFFCYQVCFLVDYDVHTAVTQSKSIFWFCPLQQWLWLRSWSVIEAS